MDPLEIMTALRDAYELIDNKAMAVAFGPTAVWQKLDHARGHLDRQLEELLAPDAEEEATHA